MKRSYRTKQQLLDENTLLTQRIEHLEAKLKLAEGALRKSEERFRTIFENSLIGIELYDHGGVLIGINQRACEISGMTPETCIHKVTLNDNPHYQDSDMREQLDNGREIRQEIRLSFETKSNETEKTETRYYQKITTQVKHISPEIGYITQIIDVTEHELSREQFREETEFLNAIVDTNQTIIVGLDKQHLIRIFSKGAEKITGYSKSEVLGKDWCALFLGFENQEILDTTWKAAWEQDYKAFQRSLRKRDKRDISWDPIHKDNTYTVTGPLQIRDGTIKTILWQNTKIYTGDDENRHLHISIGVDITERKQAEKEKEKLQIQLTQAQKMESVGRLAGGVAHDFNNMLGVILGHVDMILEEIDPALSIYADLTEIRKAALRSVDLTRQLLAFARKQTVELRVLDLNRTLEGMFRMLRRLIGENIDLIWLPGKDLGSVFMDPSQIDQMVANLCVNARDAIVDTGKITIETGTVVFDKEYCSEHAGFVPGDYVRLTVSDNGCGMSQELLPHIFEPFFTTKALGKGTGLGLATIYGIIKQNNGFVNVYSELGQGTTFNIYLPRHTDKTGQIQEQNPKNQDLRGYETILLVEDEPAILRMTTMMLERQGYTVLGASMPSEAIRMASEHASEIHLLMTDVVMPEMNGRDLAQKILSLYPGLKCLFMSGYTANVIAHHGVLDQGVNFIQKPFSKGDLAVKVRDVLDQNECI